MNTNFSSIDFLEDVKHQIKMKYNNQEAFAKIIGYSRKSLNSGDNLTIGMINIFCKSFNLKIENYCYKR